MDRLQKVMARAGVASRRKSEQMIRDGKVQVNGEVVTELGVKVDANKDRIEVEGRPIKPEQKRYILFHKPTGVITSMSDPQNRPVVADFVRDLDERVYPVGRLDFDTEGLLLLTNDGELAHRLTHPRHEVDKVYRAKVKGIPGAEALRHLQSGVELSDGWTAPARVRLVQSGKRESLLEMTLHEGRNRQVRRMCEAVGHPVLHLQRIRLDFLTLDGLKTGHWRELTRTEQHRLKKRIGLMP